MTDIIVSRAARFGASPARKVLDRILPWGPVTRARLARSAAIYAGLLSLAATMGTFGPSTAVKAFGLGLAAPGAGFLLWAGADSPTQLIALGLTVAAATAFLVSLLVWFATGNVLLPPAVWLTAAIAAAGGPAFGLDGGPANLWLDATRVVPLGVFLLLGFAAAGALIRGHAGRLRREALDRHLSGREAVPVPEPTAAQPTSDELSPEELSPEDLRLMRLILDRALQPVDAFSGFEWVDQFQTAAVRYQLNFMSYALSMAQRVHLEAFDGYLRTAQDNLTAKQTDPRVWRYWRLENAWGNLRTDADPIPRDNVMFTGFLAAQIAYDRAASGQRAFDAPGALNFARPNGRQTAYSFPALIDVLVQGYARAGFGLLACEPNWIYPLCNTIAATAIRAGDASEGTDHWRAIGGTFRRALESEFMTADGRFVPCRSTLTGLAMPSIGGAVMQAFPCLFLNALFPDLAERQWAAVRHAVRHKGWRTAIWPVDVGNYRFSRASGFAACAAAAVELGDGEAARCLLDLLDEACPATVTGSVAHRPNASLWAHGVELMARCGRAGALRSLVTAPAPSPRPGPFLKNVSYPDLLVAKATRTGGTLRAVLYPGKQPGFKAVTIGGLLPGRRYTVTTYRAHPFTADAGGAAQLNLFVSGRTAMRVAPSS